ncbi:entericidin, EcnA/B family [Ferruginivarius sediminum]|uniref:Entericidin, EcnA/B family n=1 Tax=Ferruginivarius sediminum TaxID=2661937 RepID=A0A369TC89_9PROT|nr:entericidin, EcnA/B family [Ferruginivarius sediminum]
MRVLALLMTALLAAGSLAACNTAEGIGKDLESAGQALQEDAEDAKD